MRCSSASPLLDPAAHACTAPRARCAHAHCLQVWVTIQRPGVFYGQCSELCGANHAFMPIVVEAVTPRQFVTNYLKKWME